MNTLRSLLILSVFTFVFGGAFFVRPLPAHAASYIIGGYGNCPTNATKPCLIQVDDSEYKLQVHVSFSGSEGNNPYTQVRLYTSAQSQFPLDSQHLLETKVVSSNHPAAYDIPTFTIDNLSNIDYYFKVTINGTSGNIIAQTAEYKISAAGPLTYHFGAGAGCSNQSAPCQTLTSSNPITLQFKATITTTGGTFSERDDQYPGISFYLDENNPPTTSNFGSGYVNLQFTKHEDPLPIELTYGDSLHGGTLTPGKTYYYQAYIGDGTKPGAKSPVYKLTIPGTTPQSPQSPQVLQASLGGGASTTVTTQQQGGGGGASTTVTTSGAQSSSFVVFMRNPLKAKSIVDFIKDIIDFLIKLAVPIIALAIIYSGYKFISARGSNEKLEAAKTTFLYTLLGSGVLLGAWALAEIVSTTLSGIIA